MKDSFLNIVLPLPKRASGLIAMAASRSDGRARTTEVEQIGVQAIFEGSRKSVASAFVDLQRRPLDDLRGQERRCGDRHNLIVVAVNDQRRDVDLLQVFGEVRFREDLDAVIRV